LTSYMGKNMLRVSYEIKLHKTMINFYEYFVPHRCEEENVYKKLN